jgi:hypothetical protein
MLERVVLGVGLEGCMIRDVKMWVVRGPAGGIAAFYGIAYTRKDLILKLASQGIPMGRGCKATRVTVREDDPRKSA